MQYTVTEFLSLGLLIWGLILFYYYWSYMLLMWFVYSLIVGGSSLYDPYYALFILISLTILFFMQRGPEISDPAI